MTANELPIEHSVEHLEKFATPLLQRNNATVCAKPHDGGDLPEVADFGNLLTYSIGK